MSINSGNCHGVALAGDTITVTPGTYSAGQNTTITKYVKLIGTGVTLTWDFASNDLLDIIDSASGNTVLQGFTFQRGATAPLSGTALGFVRVSPGTNGKPVLITGNTFNLTATGNSLYFTTNRGVIWNNQFSGTLTTSTGNPQCWGNNSALRVKLPVGASAWTVPPLYGDQDTDGTYNVYFETNYLHFMQEAIDCDDHCRLVSRFNTFDYSQGGGTHGADTSTYGSRTNEYYANTMQTSNANLCLDGSTGLPTHGVNQADFIGMRNGAGFIHNNAIQNLTSGWGNKSEIESWIEALRRLSGSYGCWADGSYTAVGGTPAYGGWPVPHQLGWGWNGGFASHGYVQSGGGSVSYGPFASPHTGSPSVAQDPEPLYYFANTGFAGSSVDSNTPFVGNFGSSPQCSPTGPDVSGFYQWDRDMYKPGGTSPGIQTGPGVPFDGTTGTGYGTRTNRPSTCTTGVVYWSTDGGTNWNPNNTNGIHGGLDRCDTTNHWTNDWYIPKAYPHPLTQGIVGGVTGMGRQRLRY